jgi:serine phosphatase RsbU (regulator of sigma subunit)
VEPANPHAIDTVLLQLGDTPSGQHRAGLLAPLNIALTILTALGLLVMLISPGFPGLLNLIIVGGSLGLHLLVFWLNRSGRTMLAAYLFTYWITAGTLWFFIDNTLLRQNLLNGALFSAVLGMCVLLAGLLLSSPLAFVFAAGNALVVLTVYWLYFERYEPTERGALIEAISVGLPIVVFLFVIAVISGLYQRALATANERLTVARQRIVRDELLRRDLAIARELQQRLYPPPPLTDASIQIASRSEPARETSGDFYDFIELDATRLGIVVADVTGKSIAAALVMAMSRGTLRSEARRHASPADVLRFANLTLCQDRSVRQMITCFYGILDTQKLTLTFSNAGHPFPVIRRAGGLEEIEICGLPLGARPDAQYVERTLQLFPGDQFVILSDGILEERNAQREIFGFERLTSTIAAADSTDPQRALEQIWQDVAHFRGPIEQSDDITLVVIQIGDLFEISDIRRQSYAESIAPYSGEQNA